MNGEHKPLTMAELLERARIEDSTRDVLRALLRARGLLNAKIVYHPEPDGDGPIVIQPEEELRELVRQDDEIYTRQSALLTFQASHIQSLTDLVGMLGALVEQYITATVVVQPGGEHADGT